jgi:hypothetical protein
MMVRCDESSHVQIAGLVGKCKELITKIEEGMEKAMAAATLIEEASPDHEVCAANLDQHLLFPLYSTAKLFLKLFQHLFH